MKVKSFFLVCLFLFASSAMATDYFTPTRIQHDVNVDIFSNSGTLGIITGYIDGVISTIKTIQNYVVIARSICFPESVNFGDIQNAINAHNQSMYEDTNDGGIIFVYMSFLEQYPCQ